MRTLFNRKHKTIRAILTTKSYLAILAENYKTHLSLNNAANPAGDMMEQDFDIKSIVEEVLVREGYSDRRPPLWISVTLCVYWLPLTREAFISRSPGAAPFLFVYIYRVCTTMIV